jgi:hypothetical protein
MALSKTASADGRGTIPPLKPSASGFERFQKEFMTVAVRAMVV